MLSHYWFLFLCLIFSSVSAATDLKIIILGDSLTEGYGVELAQTFPRLLEKKLNADSKDKKIKYQVLAGGVGGATSASALSRLKWHLKAKPHWLIISLGANDGLRGLKVTQSQKNLSALIQYALKKKLKVFLAGMKVPPNYGKTYANQFEKMYESLSKKWKVPLIPFLLAHVAGEPDKNIEDGIHPNAKGHAIIADNLFHFLQAYQ